jgi:hypothetical protein
VQSEKLLARRLRSVRRRFECSDATHSQKHMNPVHVFMLCSVVRRFFVLISGVFNDVVICSDHIAWIGSPSTFRINILLSSANLYGTKRRCTPQDNVLKIVSLLKLSSS